MKNDFIGFIVPVIAICFVVYIVEEYIAVVLAFIGVVIFSVLFFVILKNAAKEEERRQELAEEEEAERVRQKKINSVQSKINKALNKLIAKYGQPDRVIRPYDKLDYGYFALFVEHKLLYINDEKFNFSDFASYKLVDNCQIEKGDIVGGVTTHSEDVFTRSMAGKFFGGKTGAIIGGTTATRHSSIHLQQNNDALIHDYTLLVNLKGINRDGIEMHLGNDWRLAAELEHLFDQIIKEGSQPKP